MNLRKEINLNKKFVLVLILINILALSLYYSYALFEVTVIQNNVVVLKTGTINLTLSTNVTNNSFTLASGGEQTINVTLNSTNLNEIGYKMYYTKSGDSTFTVKSPTDFQNNIVEGEMTSFKTFTLTFKNTGANSLTINLFGIGGLAGYPINLEEGQNEIELTPIPVSEKVLAASVKTGTCANKTTVADTDDFGNPMTYISGTKTCIDFNYVWYSGKMWRIVAIYNDGSMKLVTNNNITSIAYNYPDTETWFYKTDTGAKSYMYQWLNEDFLDTLYDPNGTIIKTNALWNYTIDETSTAIKPSSITANNQQTTTAPVGLLSMYEYQKAYANNNATTSTNYLNIGYYWWTLTPYSGSNVRYVYRNGSGNNYSPSAAFGVRPSIILQSSISMTGSGTSDSPYKIVGDLDSPVLGTTKVNERVFVKNGNTYSYSGEYVKIKNESSEVLSPLYRIVGVEKDANDDDVTKIVAMDFATYDNEGTIANTKSYCSTGTDAQKTTFGQCQDSNGWYTYLNSDSEGGWYYSLKTTYGDKFTEGLYYIGTVGNSSSAHPNYKLSICASESDATTRNCSKVTPASFQVGLLRFGEMFATRETTGDVSPTYMWLITPYSGSIVRYVDHTGRGNRNSPSNAYGVRPSIHLKSDIIILSGEGTLNNPYIVGYNNP